MIHPATLVGDEKFLYKRIIELIDRSFERNRSEFSLFLNQREQQIAKIAAGSEGIFFGGYPESDRKIFGSGKSNEQFPICGIELICKQTEKLNHRWVLGTLMSLGIDRGNIGDIIPDFGSCVVVGRTNVKQILLDEIRKIGSIGVTVKEKELSEITASQDFERVTGTISSTRLDSLVALITKQSRAKSLDLFRAQKVQHNYKIEEKGSVEFNPNDIVTIKGCGKFIVDSIGFPTKKGRLPIECRRYL